MTSVAGKILWSFLFFKRTLIGIPKARLSFSEYSQSKGPVFLDIEEEKLICHILVLMLARMCY